MFWEVDDRGGMSHGSLSTLVATLRQWPLVMSRQRDRRVPDWPGPGTLWSVHEGPYHHREPQVDSRDVWQQCPLHAGESHRPGEGDMNFVFSLHPQAAAVCFSQLDGLKSRLVQQEDKTKDGAYILTTLTLGQ